MKSAVFVSVLLLVSSPMVAQRGSFSGGAGRGAAGVHSSGARRFGPVRSRGRSISGFNQRFGPGFYGDFYPYAYPLFGDDYDAGYPYDLEYPIPPTVVVERPLPPPVIVQQAPTPAGHAVTHEYAALASTAPGGGEPTFLIALHDGSQRAATAVWVQNGAVHYIGTDDRSEQIPLTLVDRNVTRQLNREKNLDLRLP